MRVLMICPELPRSEKPGSMAPGARQIRSIQQAGVDTQIVDMRGTPKLKYLQALPRIRRIIHDVDLIHAHYGYCGWLALLGRKISMRSIPVVMSFMGDDLLGTTKSHAGDVERLSRIQASWNARMAAWYDQVIVKSQQMADLIAPAKSHVVSNGIDVNVFRPADRAVCCKQLCLSPDKRRVLFPGDPENVGKGYVLACESVKAAQRVMGTELELLPLWGVKPDDVPHFMNACDVMLMTSFTEGSPNVIKEGLACNMKIVSVPVGDVREMLDGVRGCQCTSSRNPEEIGRAVAAQLLNEDHSNGREVILARGLSLENVAQRIIAIYELALGSSAVHGQAAA